MFIHISISEIFNRALLNILVLVLTGNPGVGKHTVSRKLAEILGYEIVDVNKEAVKVGTVKQNDSIDVDVEKTKKILKEKISEKSLIVGHLAPFVGSKELFSMAIVLRKNPYDIIQIYEIKIPKMVCERSFQVKVQVLFLHHPDTFGFFP